MVDTLVYAKTLEDAGVARKAAETHAHLISNVVEVELTTKQDFQGLKQEFQGLRQEFQGLRQEFQGLRQEFAALDQDLRRDMEREFQRLRLEIAKDFVNLENRLIIKLGALMTTLFVTAVAAMKLI